MARRASQEGSVRRFWPLIDSFLNARTTPRNSGEARIQGVWRSAEPLIGEVHLTLQFPKDPFPGGTTFKKIALENPRKITAVMNYLGENDHNLINIAYCLHCQRCSLSDAWLSFCINQKVIIQHHTAFINVQFQSAEGKQISLQEARDLPLSVDLSPIPNNRYALKMLVKLNGFTKSIIEPRTHGDPSISHQSDLIGTDVNQWANSLTTCMGNWTRSLNQFPGNTLAVRVTGAGQRVVNPAGAARSRTSSTQVRPRRM